jgi:hypothetical protein
MSDNAKEGLIIFIITLYLIGCTSVASIGLIAEDLKLLPKWILPYTTELNCIFFGLLGGSLYCLRAVYQTRCVRKTWDNNWLSWYLIRPIASSILGGMSVLFIAMGLLAFTDMPEPTQAVYIVAFFAGLNVDRFLKKLEGQISASLGVDPSRQSQNSE